MRAVTRLLLTTLAAAAVSVSVVPAASAGQNGCAWIGAGGGKVTVQHNCGVSGYYHMDVWGGGRSATTGTYFYNGGTKYRTLNWPVPAGTDICTQLWFHRPGGGYEPKGLPCDKM